MAQARKFTSLKAAHDWLTKRGFGQTAMQHVWQDGKVTAWISIQLGGTRPTFMPKFLVAMGDSMTDAYWQRVAVVAARRTAEG